MYKSDAKGVEGCGVGATVEREIDFKFLTESLRGLPFY